MNFAHQFESFYNLVKGITSLMMACKYEEIYSPDIEDFTYICDNAYEAGK